MQLVHRLLAISLSLLLGLQFALADGGPPDKHRDVPPRVAHSDHVKGQAVDVRSVPVLIEAMLLQVRLDKEHIDSGVDLALLAGATKPDGIAANGVAGGAKLSLVRDRAAFLRDLQEIGETTVLAAPRIMTLNKQPAEIHLGGRLGYLKTTVNQTTTTQTVEFINLGTQLRVRPFVASDGMIRLEVHAERTTGGLDGHGVPQTNTCEVTTNVMLRDGATTAVGGTICTEAVEDDDLAPLRCLPCVDFLLGDPPAVATRRELIVLLTAHVVKPPNP